MIGADASILDFIKEADCRPCRLVVSGTGIIGLVTRSDIQKLPGRAALFALVTGLEISMSEAIDENFSDFRRRLAAVAQPTFDRKKIQEKIQQEQGLGTAS